MSSGTTSEQYSSSSSNKSLDENEKQILSEITKDNALFRRKLKHANKTRSAEKKKSPKDKERKPKKSEKNSNVAPSSPIQKKSLSPKSARSPKNPQSPTLRASKPQSPKIEKVKPVKPAKPAKPQVPAPTAEDPQMVIMRQRLGELEKMQEMYRQRINELEDQVSSFSVFHILNNPAVQQVVDDVVQQQQTDKTEKNKITKKTSRTLTPTSALPLPQTESLFDGHRGKKKETTIPSDFLDIPVASIQSKFLDQFAQFPKVKKTPSTDFVVKPKLLALYDYETNIPGRLSFSEGQILFLRKKSSTGWWTAELDGKIGKIPSNHVEYLDASKAFRAKVIKEFKEAQIGDMGIRRGEIVTILKKQDNGWWLGERNGKTGFFPSKNVERITGNPDA